MTRRKTRVVKVFVLVDRETITTSVVYEQLAKILATEILPLTNFDWQDASVDGFYGLTATITVVIPNREAAFAAVLEKAVVARGGTLGETDLR